MESTFELSDLLPWYPSIEDENFQELITSKKEFLDLSPESTEPAPQRGRFFSHQLIAQVFLSHYDALLFYHKTGTGKTCAFVAVAEYFNKISKVGGYIKRAIIITKGPSLVKELKYQIACRCTEEGVYETPMVQNAKTSSGRESNLTRELTTFYLIDTKRKFSTMLKNTYPNTPEGNRRLREDYSGSLIIIDEAHWIYPGNESNVGYLEGEARDEDDDEDEDDLAIEDDILSIAESISEIDEKTPRNRDPLVQHRFRERQKFREGRNRRRGASKRKLDLEDEDEKEPSMKKKEVYEQLWRLTHAVERSKIIVATATPAINQAKEVVPIVNLILPDTHQMSTLHSEWEGSKVPSQEYFEEYLKGRVSYVRELDTGAIPKLQGVTNVTELPTGDGDEFEASIITWNSLMSDVQRATYNRIKGNSGGNSDVKSEGKKDVYVAERQATLFVYPEGMSSSEGYKRYISGVKSYQYSAKNGLEDIISTIDGIHELSCKYSEIIKLVDGNINPLMDRQETLDLIEDPEQREKADRTYYPFMGNAFVYSDFKEASGIVPLSLCFEAMKYEKFTESQSIFVADKDVSKKTYCEVGSGASRRVRDNFPKKKRYALFTPETPARIGSVLMEAMNSYENRHGEYIKVFLSSAVGRDGINVNNCLQIHMTSPLWTPSGIYQAISRGVRATSHNDLIAEERQRLIEAGLDSSKPSIEVRVFQHAAVSSPPNSGELESFDMIMYQRATQKDFLIKKMERMLKICAFDCQLLRKRNIRPTDTDYSSVCDYQLCDYECAGNPPTSIDYSSYEILYSQKLIENLMSIIINLYRTIFSATLSELTERKEISEFLSNNSIPDEKMARYIILALEKIISTKIPVADRFGFINFLLENDDIYYLERDFKTTESNIRDIYYSKNIIGTTVENLSNIVQDLQKQDQQVFIDQLYEIAGSYELTEEEYNNETPDERNARFAALKENGKFSSILSVMNADTGLSIETLIELFEQVVIEYYMYDRKTAFNTVLLDIFSEYFKILHKPEQEIENNVRKDNTSGKTGRRKKEFTITDIKPINILKYIKEGDDFTVNNDGNIVYVHVLYILKSLGRTNYGNTSRKNKFDTRFRVLEPNKNIDNKFKWNDATGYELKVYNKYFQLLGIEERIPFEKRANGIAYGIYENGEFLIRDILHEDTLKAEDDMRSYNKGKQCSHGSFKESVFLELMYEFKIPPPSDVEPSEKTKEELVEILYSSNVKGMHRNLEELDHDVLEYIYMWVKSSVEKTTTAHLCKKLQEYMKEHDLILTI